jgi:hypothetical protein
MLYPLELRAHLLDSKYFRFRLTAPFSVQSWRSLLDDFNSSNLRIQFARCVGRGDPPLPAMVPFFAVPLILMTTARA